MPAKFHRYDGPKKIIYVNNETTKTTTLSKDLFVLWQRSLKTIKKTTLFEYKPWKKAINFV